MLVPCLRLTCLPLWATALAVALGFSCAGGSASGQAAKEADSLRAPFLLENERWLVDGGLGKLTEEEVVKKLGRPDRLHIERDEITGKKRTFLIWEDVSRVVVDFSLDDGKAYTLDATFSPYIMAKKLTPENFHRLNPGISEAEVDGLIGGVKSVGTATVEYVVPKGTKNAKLKRVEWTASRQLRLWFDKGKLAGVVGGGGLKE